MEIGVWMLVFAVIFDFLGFGKRQWANRVAAVLALGGMVRLLAPSKLGQLIRGWAQDLADLAGNALGQFDPQWGTLLASMGVAALALIAIVLWMLKLAPSHNQLGPASTQEIDSRWIWGGAAVCALFVSAVPGAIGQGMTWVAGMGANIGSSATEAVVSLGQVGGWA